MMRASHYSDMAPLPTVIPRRSYVMARRSYVVVWRSYVVGWRLLPVMARLDRAICTNTMTIVMARSSHGMTEVAI